jgi:RNA polymerase sigma-70 factor (ECF subfamily)
MEGNNDSDQELIAKAQRGNQEAMTTLYIRYRRKVLNYLYRFTGNRSTAEELMQETFVRVVQNIHRYKPTGSAAGWIYRIAGNLALNAMRDHPLGRELSLDEPLTLEEDAVDRGEAIPGFGPKPGEEAVRTEREQAVQGGLLKLSPLHREVVILCDIQGFSYREAAQVLKCPVNTIASRLARGRAELAGLLGYLKKEV